MSMTRYSRWMENVALKTDATTPVIDLTDTAFGAIFIVASESQVLLTYWGAPDPDGTFLPLQDKNGNAVTQVVAHTKAYPILEAAFGCRAIKLYADAAGLVDISLKA